MASKLSAKQKAILIEAYKRHRENDNDKEIETTGRWQKAPDDMLYAYEILNCVYGWDFCGAWPKPHLGGHNYNIETIGEKRYNADRASLSRTLKRLEERDLVNIWRGRVGWAGIRLTESGLNIARELAETVKTLAETTGPLTVTE